MAIKYIKRDPEKRLTRLLAHQNCINGLYNLYDIPLTDLWQEDEEGDEFAEDTRSVLGIMVCSPIPLSETALDKLLGWTESRSRGILLKLQSFVQWSPGQPTRFFHHSYADYFKDSKHCGTKPWFINEPDYHGTIALQCFLHMKARLEFNICKLGTSYLRNRDVLGLSQGIKSSIPDHLSYSCRFWGDHIGAATFTLKFADEIQDFLHGRLLYWLEVLSLIGEVSVASPALLSAVDWIEVRIYHICYILSCLSPFPSEIKQASQTRY